MNRKRSLLPWVIVGAIVALVAAFFLTEDRRSDVELIREAFNESVEASKEGRPGGVMDLISANFRINDESPSRNQIADVIRRSRPDVEVVQFDPIIRGDQATVVSPVRLEASVLTQRMKFAFEDVRLTFQREPGTRWLFFPTRRWRLVQVQVPPEQLPEGLQL